MYALSDPNKAVLRNGNLWDTYIWQLGVDLI